MSEDTKNDNPVVAETSDQEPSRFTVTVRDTFSGEEKEVEVTEEVYNEFRRGKWRKHKSDQRHQVNSTPFSSLRGNDGDCFDRYNEFADERANPENLLVEIIALHQSLKILNDAELDLIINLFFKGVTQTAYAERLGIAQSNVSRKKKRILEKLKKFLG